MDYRAYIKLYVWSKWIAFSFLPNYKVYLTAVWNRRNKKHVVWVWKKIACYLQSAQKETKEINFSILDI